MIGRTNSTFGGSISLPDGSTATANDVQTWLKCAGINKSYTSVSQVVADTDTMFLLMSDENAMKYLARSTDFADTICADETSMTYLGQSAYVDSTILNSDLWFNKCLESQYYDKVFKDVRTIHAGAYETITMSFTNRTIITNSDGNVNFPIPNGTYTFTGSVSGQSFTRSVTSETTDVYVMPEGSLYWYGNECIWITGGWSTPRTRLSVNGNTYIGKFGVKNTNYLSNQHNGNDEYFDGFETVNAVDCSGYSKLSTKSRVLGTDTNGLCIGIANNTSTFKKGEAIFDYQNPTSTSVILTTSNRLLQDTFGYGLFFQSEYINRDHALYAMWLE